jgi:Tfp pilus assembly PilM family ATPase
MVSHAEDYRAAVCRYRYFRFVGQMAGAAALKKGGYRVANFGEVELPQGAVVNGIVQNVGSLAHALTDVKMHLKGIECAHAALPEEDAYVFEMRLAETRVR